MKISQEKKKPKTEEIIKRIDYLIREMNIVYYICKEITGEEINKATGKTGSGT